MYRVTHLLGNKLPLTKFQKFRQLLGCCCSFLLPRQGGGTSQIQVNGMFLPSRCVTLYNLLNQREPSLREALTAAAVGFYRRTLSYESCKKLYPRKKELPTLLPSLLCHANCVHVRNGRPIYQSSAGHHAAARHCITHSMFLGTLTILISSHFIDFIHSQGPFT